MIVENSTGSVLKGVARVPGDKSISHRAALLGALAVGTSEIDNFLKAGVTKALLNCLSELGVRWEIIEDRLIIQSPGYQNWNPPQVSLNCGNSGTTMRLLVGALAASGVPAVLDGTEGLRRRPMGRIVEPLTQLGVKIKASDTGTAPLILSGRAAGMSLQQATIRLPVSSAQVKSCLILASLAADGSTSIIEPVKSRDHTERMLVNLGMQIESRVSPNGEHWVTVQPPKSPIGSFKLQIPGDSSAAAFLIVAATILPGSNIVIRGVNLNPTRIGMIEVLLKMGAEIELLNCREAFGEPIGDIRVSYSPLKGITIGGSQIVDMIDEFPVFAVAAAMAHGETIVRDAVELRHKESDRISMLCQEMIKVGVDMEEKTDGFIIHGNGSIQGGTDIDTHGDHRIAMAFIIASLASINPIMVRNANIFNESFPTFLETLQSIGGKLSIRDRYE